MSQPERPEVDVQAELEERLRCLALRECFCGTWIPASDPDFGELESGEIVEFVVPAYLDHPHPKCSCEPAKKLRAEEEARAALWSPSGFCFWDGLPPCPKCGEDHGDANATRRQDAERRAKLWASPELEV